jgi:hypothetical protein
MIINSTTGTLETNVQPNKALGFGISDVRLVVDILSKLYAYPIRTLVQEYICNGRDAMREAGTWGKMPMVISVPNKFEPTFKVRDYGVGITPDRMENIFVNYGSSTKRNTNTQTGGFGIGAKSAFSYTDSFTITSFVDGIKYLYVAHLGDQGGVNLIQQSKTNEANGVEISIGVKSNDTREFTEAVQRCVRYWSEPIKFHGVADGEINQRAPIATLDNMAIYSGETKTIYLVDGIEYDVMEEQTKSYWKDIPYLNSHNHVVAINVPNGFFKIASSRERLENNDDNKQKQKNLFNNCKKHIQNVIDTKINVSNLSLTSKIDTKKKFSGFFTVNQCNIALGNGANLMSDCLVLDKTVDCRYVLKTRRMSKPKYEYNASNSIDLTKSILVVTENEKKEHLIARKINAYLEQNQNTRVFITKKASDIPFAKELIKTILDVSTMSLPAPTPKALKPKKSTRDAIVWRLAPNSRNQTTVEQLNTASGVCVIVYDLTPEAQKLSQFINVYLVPKINKDLILKQGMTVEEGQKYLLSKHNKECVPVYGLPYVFKKINMLKKFDKPSIEDALLSFLWSLKPELKQKQETLQAEYKSLEDKFPLIKVLKDLSTYNTMSQQIVIDLLNKEDV